MLRLKKKSVIPPKGWFYTEEGIKFEAHSFEQLQLKVQLFRMANKGDLTLGWEERFEGQLCEQRNFGRNFCRYEHDGTYNERTLTWHDIKVFLAVVKSWISTGRELESETEANRRAAICSKCPFCVQIGGCASCHGLVDNAMALIGKRSTPHDGEIHACKICGCSCKVMVHLKMETLARGLQKDHIYPNFCWKANIKDYRPDLQ